MEVIEGLVSIITPAYNAEKFISQTIESVLNQTYKNWEMIIVNDCSSDNTRKIVESYKDKRIILINLNENKGTANAWNIAFSKMKGEYIAFLDSDDLWSEKKLELQIAFMKKNNYSFTCTSYDWIDEESKPLNKIIRCSAVKTYNRVLSNTNIGLLTVILSRKEFPNIQVKNCLPLLWDLYLWAILLNDGHKCYGLNQILSHYRIVSNSQSRNKKKHALAVWQLYRNELHISLISSIFFFSGYALNSLKRHYFN